MREYELTYLVSDEVLEKDHKIITDRVAGIISDQGGKISKEETWGRRKLTYPIKKQNFATYITVWFQLPKEKIIDIEHELQVHPQIIRHLIVVKVAKSEELVVTKEDIIGTEDVEKVIGEKSFEQVVGHKEESYDLMAKREKEEAEETEELKNLRTEKQKEEKEEPIAKKTVTAEPKKKVTKKVKKEEPVKAEPEAKPEIKTEPPVGEPKSQDDEADPSRQGDAEADRIKKLDEKLDELLKDDL